MSALALFFCQPMFHHSQKRHARPWHFDDTFHEHRAGAAGVSGRDLLFRALANLLDNVVKYTPAGGRIEILLGAKDSAIQLVIADNGPGIPEHARTKVFERFFRPGASRSQPGNGLGMSLVSAVAELHGASVQLADNNPGLRVILKIVPASLSNEPQYAVMAG